MTVLEPTPLLMAVATPDLSDDTGTTALHMAIYENRATLARLLIARGASLEARTAEGRALLHTAAETLTGPSASGSCSAECRPTRSTQPA